MPRHLSLVDAEPRLVRHELMTPGDLRLRLGMSRASFHRYQKRGDFRKFEVRQPIGLLKYSRRLVDLFVDGESIVRVGRGSRAS